jgi:heme/copper-type cytochrome/quinol oxidase subunit 1
MPQFDIFLNGSLYSWIIYPPLSAVPRQQEISSLTITNFLTILQAFSIVMLIVSSILTGMNQRSTMHNPV